MKCQTIDRIGMPTQDADLFSRGRIPQTNLIIGSTGRDDITFRRVGRVIHVCVVVSATENLCEPRNIPDSNRPVLTCRDKPIAIGRETDRFNGTIQLPFGKPQTLMTPSEPPEAATLPPEAIATAVAPWSWTPKTRDASSYSRNRCHQAKSR